jgi:hypothetical protein
MAGYIIRIHAHPASKQEQITILIQLAANSLVDQLGLIRSKVKGSNL